MMHSFNRLFALVLISWTIASCFADEGSWSYDRDDVSLGPASWGKNFAECALDRNSPIDIKNDKTRVAEDWYLSRWDKQAMWTVLDLKHTIKFSLEGDTPITTDGGNLGDLYKLLQFHFHWGSSNELGSEHTVGGNAYPMEVHFVHQRDTFADVTAAVMSEEDDALAAVGFFFELQEEDNPELAKLVEAVQMVRLPANNGTVSGYSLNQLTDFLMTSFNKDFYRYFGGLTTPGCQQIVKWTVFQTPIGISAAQMAIFRDQGPSPDGTEFYRDVQPVGQRTVVKYEVYSAASSHTALLSISLLSVLALYL